MFVAPIIIPIHYNGGGGGPFSFGAFFLATAIVFYAIQIVCVWASMFIGDFTDKRSFLWWNIPFLPAIMAFIKKFKQIGRAKK